MGGEPIDGDRDTSHCSSGGIRVVACDVLGFVVEIG
jgi:hypothetical protein